MSTKRKLPIKNNLRIWHLALFLLLCFHSSIGIAFGASHQTADHQKGWLLVQEHKQLGLQYVYLTHDAVKIVNKNFNFVVLIAPPYREVAIFRPDDHVIYNASPNEFQHSTFLPTLPTGPRKLSKLLKIGEQTIQGLHIIKYNPEHTYDELWAITNIDLAAPVLDVVYAFYHLDYHVLPYRKVVFFHKENKTDHGNPWLNLTVNDAYAGKTTFFDTRSAKETTFTAKDFAYPIGFKKLEKATQVLLSKSGASKLTDIIEDMAVGEDLGKHESSGSNKVQPPK